MLRDDPAPARASQRARGESESAVDDLLRADEERRSSLQRFEVLRAEQAKRLLQIVWQHRGPHAFGYADVADALVTSPNQLLINGKIPGTISL